MGEPIVGYITRGKGVSVHSVDCPNVRNLVYDPGRRIEVEWGSGAEGGYEVRLAVDLEDRMGALAAVTAAALYDVAGPVDSVGHDNFVGAVEGDR